MFTLQLVFLYFLFNLALAQLNCYEYLVLEKYEKRPFQAIISTQNTFDHITEITHMPFISLVLIISPESGVAILHK